METFKYYRRGTGELDTSNFPEIVKQGHVYVHHLDSRTTLALMALNTYIFRNLDLTDNPLENFTVSVTGYVCHMRADKDLIDTSEVYGTLGFTFNVHKVQHDSRNEIGSAKVDKDQLSSFHMMRGVRLHKTLWVGADSSVHKFFPEVDVEARKVRENGKVVSLELDLPETQDTEAVVIVDDILGGGATVQMLVDQIKESGYTGDILLWVEWNEGIHKPEFLEQFTGYYIGESIYEVN